VKASARTVNFPKEVRKEDVKVALSYLNGFIKTFSDPAMIETHKKIAKSFFVSKSQINLIGRRQASISTKEIDNPQTYIIKYWRVLIPLVVATKCPTSKIVLFPSTFTDLDDAIAFFDTFGFLNDDHIKRIKQTLLSQGNSDSVLRKSRAFIKNLTTTTNQQKEMQIFEDFLKHLLRKLRSDRVKELDFYKTEKETENIFYNLLINLLKKRETQLSYSQEESSQPVPQAFLTLNKMRKALRYVP